MGLHRESWAAVDPVILELCRLRIAMLLGDQEEQARRSPGATAAGFDEAKAGELARWADSPRFSAAERACLAFAEQFVVQVSGMTEADTGAVLEHLSPAQLYGLATAILALDGHQRLRLALARVLGDPGVAQ